MKSKKSMKSILISILFLIILVLIIRKVREEVSNAKTDTAIDVVQEFDIRHNYRSPSPDSQFQKLLDTGNVKIAFNSIGDKCVTLDSVRSIIPEFKGGTYNELKEKYDSLKLDICVRGDVFNVTEDSIILSGQRVRFLTYPDFGTLTYPEGNFINGITFEEYILYKNDKDIIFEGISYYHRSYYKLVFEGDGKLRISEKYNLDVPNESIIVHTSKDFTVTLEGKNLKMWQYGKTVYSTEIPKPANENEELFVDHFNPVKKSGKYYGEGKPYIDEDGNLIQLKIAPGSTELHVECLVLASDVAEIVSYQPGSAFVFKDKSGNYFAELLDKDDFGKEAVKLCQENIGTLIFKIKTSDLSKLQSELLEDFNIKTSNSGKLESLWLIVWLEDQKEAVNIKVYTPSNPVGELEDSIKNKIYKVYHDVSECEKSYNEIVSEIQRLEK